MLRLIHTVSLRTESKGCKEARKGRAAALFRQPEAIHLLTLSSPQAQPRRKHPSVCRLDCILGSPTS